VNEQRRRNHVILDQAAGRDIPRRSCELGRARPGQDLRAQALPLGAADSPAAEGDGGLGRFGRKGLERKHQIQDLPISAARPRLRSLRHGARRHCRFHLCQSRLSARPIPDHFRRRIALPGWRCQRGQSRSGRVVSKIRRKRNERRQILFLVHSRPADLAFQQEKKSLSLPTSKE